MRLKCYDELSWKQTIERIVYIFAPELTRCGLYLGNYLSAPICRKDMKRFRCWNLMLSLLTISPSFTWLLDYFKRKGATEAEVDLHEYMSPPCLTISTDCIIRRPKRALRFCVPLLWRPGIKRSIDFCIMEHLRAYVKMYCYRKTKVIWSQLGPSAFLMTENIGNRVSSGSDVFCVCSGDKRPVILEPDDETKSVHSLYENRDSMLVIHLKTLE